MSYITSANITTLLAIAAVVIVSNATCERTFSKMALIKTELRNRPTILISGILF